jgi:hypothetical protein
MEMKAKTSHVLMSEELRGQVPELDDEQLVEAASAGKHVLVIAERILKNARTGVVGIMRGILFDVEPEVEMRINLTEALDLVEAPDLLFGSLELHHGERVVKVPGPFIVKAARVDDIDANEQLCTLSLHLKKPAR